MESGNKLVIKARAKLNLCLKITGRAGNKHELDTLIVPVGLADTVIMEKSADVTIRYEGKEGLFDNDTVKKTVELLQSRYFDGGVGITIIKNIPEKAGVGGSSADAAAVARGLERLYGFTVAPELLAEIGSDVPAMYLDAPCRMRGTGKDTEPLLVPEGMKYALVIPERGVSTAECFRLYDIIGGENPDVEEIVARLKKKEYFAPKNALEKSATELAPEIGTAISALREAGFCAGMTGSGSGAFGYEYDAEAFDKKLKRLSALLDRKEYGIITTF